MRGSLLLLLLLSFSDLALAQAPRDFVPARGVAMGGGRLAASGNEAIFLNPAALGMRRAYTLQLDYTSSSGANAAQDGSALVLSIVDSVSNPLFPTGIAYRYVSIGEGKDEKTLSSKDVSVAIPIGGTFWLGTHLTYLSFSEDKKEYGGFTGDVGLLAAFGEVKAGLVATNLINVDSSDAVRGLGVGLALSDEYTYRFSSDLRWDFLADKAPRSWTIGAEYVLADVLPLRLGYDWDSTRATEFASFGTGFQTAQFGFDVSYRLDRTADVGYWAFAMKLFGI